MKAREIKEILISYLTADNPQIRIYAEKSIGSSICDLMAVTDKLIGFEIKSDADNYSRLNSQIKAYEKFFNLNYIVVGESHANSAYEKVPANWGIIEVRTDGVTVLRQARDHNDVDVETQLSILWQLELKNILIKHGMPLYAQKSKQYIVTQIANYLDRKTINAEVVNELLHRDYSVFNGDNEVLSSAEENSSVPIQEMADIISETDLSAFTLDKWIEIYKRGTELKKQKVELYTKSDTERTPHTIPYTDIEIALGAPWIPKEIIKQFICHILGKPLNYDGVSADYEEVTSNWHINGKCHADGNVNAEVKYGLKRYNALQIIESTLNLREIKLFNKKKEFSERDTMLAVEKQRLINDEFKRWVWEDEDRRWMIESAYNKMFAAYKKPAYDGSSLKFPQMSESYDLYPYQKDAVKRITENRNTLLAYDVGAGKTYIMIAAAMNMRIDGISRKNLFVVPNHIVGQWEKIFTDLYPNAKVLAVEPKNFKPEMRNKVLRQIKDGDYDGIIMAYSCFEMIPLSPKAVLANIQDKLNKINEALQGFINPGKNYYDMSSTDQFRYTKLSNEKQYIQKITKEFIDSMGPQQTDDVTFDELEISTLFLDEAHNYKNLPIKTKLKNLRGISTTGSKKCADMLNKIRVIQSADYGRGIVFATGTPLCNSISDAYAMQVYLQNDELERLHLDIFDNWVKTFARPEQLCEIDVDTSKYRLVRRFSTFYNLPELSAMFSQVADFYAITDTAELPVLEGYTDVNIEKSEDLRLYMLELNKRSEKIRKKDVDRSKDNMLKVCTDGRKAALDLSLVGIEQKYDSSSKIYNCVGNVYNLYVADPTATQLIFCDYSTPKPDEFNVYTEIKNRLIEKGIPKEEIAFIHSYSTDIQKVELFRKFNAGEMRILIGSTFKLGIGANVQCKLKAIHHLDVPWRPADMVQREGRIMRRGNENKNVLIYRYIIQGSFDAYSWQVLETKQKFISQFLSGSTYQRSISDLENNVLTYAQVKALALDEPLMKQLAEKENEAKQLKIFIAKAEEENAALRKEQENARETITAKKNAVTMAICHESVIRLAKEETLQEECRKISGILTEDVVMKREPLTQEICILGFVFSLPEVQDEKKPYGLLTKDGNTYTVELGSSASGNARRIIGVLKRLPKEIERLKADLQKTQDRIEQIDELLKDKSTYPARLAEVELEIAELKEQVIE